MSARKPRDAYEADERAFLEAYDASAFPHPSVAVDVVLLGILDDALVVSLVRRSEHPFSDRFALPGGFVKLDESLDAAAARVLREKAGLEGLFVEQLYTFGAVARDPRTRVVSVAYYALVDGARFTASVRTGDATIGRIESVDRDGLAVRDERGKRIALAFDHADIVATAVKRIRGKLDYTPIGYELLPREFTLHQLQRVHEIVAGRTFNKDSFRRRVLATALVTPTSSVQRDVDHRPAALYRYATPEPSEKPRRAKASR